MHSEFKVQKLDSKKNHRHSSLLSDYFSDYCYDSVQFNENKIKQLKNFCYIEI